MPFFPQSSEAIYQVFADVYGALYGGEFGYLGELFVFLLVLGMSTLAIAGFASWWAKRG